MWKHTIKSETGKTVLIETVLAETCAEEIHIVCVHTLYQGAPFSGKN